MIIGPRFRRAIQETGADVLNAAIQTAEAAGAIGRPIVNQVRAAAGTRYGDTNHAPWTKHAGRGDVDAVCGKCTGHRQQGYDRYPQPALQKFRVHCSVPLLFLPHPASARCQRREAILSTFGAAGWKSRQPSVWGYLVIVTPDVMIPPALDLMVVSGGGGTLVKRIVNTPVANGI